MSSCLQIAVLISFIASSAWCADPFYVASWKISSASVAPWWSNASQKPDAAESKALVGQTVVLQAKSITGPRQVACKTTHYAFKDYPADMLFQGMFGEMQRRDRSADPAKAAASVGFRGTKWKTLETGCANELELHFIDGRTAAFGLNNYIYILKREIPKKE